jgi:bifunctional DNA-binding transcriptional regulator/antitoxin component of YhaV-PrlF toxin-antitoxin module
MTKTKVSADQNVKIPSSILNKYSLKEGDIFTIQIVSGSIVLTPEKLKEGRRFQKKRNGRSRNHPKPAAENVRGLDDERQDWLRLSLQGLERAYGDNEPEYTSEMIIEPNPEYERR